MADPQLTPEQIDDIARSYFEAALEADEEQRARARPGHGVYIQPREDEDPISSDQDILLDALSEATEALANNDFRSVRRHVLELLEQGGGPADPKSEAFTRLARGLLRAHAEVLRMAHRRREGDYAVQPRDPLFSWRPSVQAMPEPAKTSAPLSAIANAFVEARLRDKKWKPITKANAVPKLKLFAQTLDDKPIDTVTPDDIRDWRDALEDLELKPSTIGQHFKVIASMFIWAKRERRSTIDNPTLGLAPKGEQSAREVYLPADLEKLFTCPLYTGHWRPDRRERPGRHLVKDSKYWLPLIALHSGMRVEEIAKLKTADIREIDGVWCFDIYETKTQAGTRQVPLHPRLIELGLLAYRDAVEGERLWPDLSLGSEGKWSQRFVQWWVGFRRMIGLDRDGLVFHSFRHTFVSHLQARGVPEAMVALIVGHKHQSITFGRYGGKLITPAEKLAAIKDADFGVDLQHLLEPRAEIA